MISQPRFRLGIVRDHIRWMLFGVPMECNLPADNDMRDSPRDVLRFEVGGEAALLCYGRPSVNGRIVFGKLVPFGELWRTGADEPTVLHLPFQASVAGLTVPRGLYSIYMVPDESRWMIVLNRSIRQSGRTRTETGKRGNVFQSAYTSAVRRAEVGRLPVHARRVPHTERLTARAEPTDASETLLLLEWEQTQIRVPIRRLNS